MERFLDELLEALAGNDGAARKRARETLVLVGEPAVAPVRALLDSPQKRVRWEAAKTLAAIVDPPSVSEFVRSLDDPQSDVRWLAGDGLINLGPRSAGPVLRSLLEGPQSTGRREMSRRVLRQLASENQVLAEIVDPVVEALDTASADAGVIAPRAGRALSDLDRVTGRLPSL